MYVLDTDTLSHLLAGREQVVERRARATREVATTVITRVEILQGRFDYLLKAEDGEYLLRAQERLAATERDLKHFLILPVEEGSAAEFDRLKGIKSLKKIGRDDLLIASITLANRATLVTRNLKHFRQVPGLDLENWAD